MTSLAYTQVCLPEFGLGLKLGLVVTKLQKERLHSVAEMKLFQVLSLKANLIRISVRIKVAIAVI